MGGDELQHIRQPLGFKPNVSGVVSATGFGLRRPFSASRTIGSSACPSARKACLARTNFGAVLCCRDTYSTARFMRDQLDWVETRISGEVFEFLVVHSDNCSSTPARF